MSEVQKGEAPNEPITLECGEIFDPELLNSSDPNFLADMDSFLKDPMTSLMKILTQSLSAHMPRPLEPIKTEHKVKIFCFDKGTSWDEIAKQIEDLLNDGYCCHMPTIVGDYVIMDFSRRKETEENEREQ